MRHSGRGRRQRLRSAKTHRQVRDLERVEEGEGLALAAFQVEREGRARAGAVAFVVVGLARPFFDED
jgi:hypothetical protein